MQPTNAVRQNAADVQATPFGDGAIDSNGC
jgi:hypothetical protein